MRKLAAAFWTILIVALCTLPGEDLPEIDVVNIDKLAHVVLFAVFGWLWIWSSDRSRSAVVRVILSGLALAILTEIYQGILPFGRQPSVWDAVANATGLAAGVWSFKLLMRRPVRQT